MTCGFFRLLYDWITAYHTCGTASFHCMCQVHHGGSLLFLGQRLECQPWHQNSSRASKQLCQLCGHVGSPPFCLKNPRQNMTPAPRWGWGNQLSSLHFVPENHGIQHLAARSAASNIESLPINPKADPTGRTGKNHETEDRKKTLTFSIIWICVSCISPAFFLYTPIFAGPHQDIPISLCLKNKLLQKLMLNQHLLNLYIYIKCIAIGMVNFGISSELFLVQAPDSSF